MIYSNSGWNRQTALQVLGLPIEADMEMAKKAYHSLCKKFHPDENKGNYALDQYLLVQQAYEYLLNADMYQMYQQNVYTPFNTSGKPPVSNCKIIGTGTRPETEARYDKIRQAALDKQRFEKAQKEKMKSEQENRRLQEERTKKALEQKRKREVESQLYRIVEVLQMLDERKENLPLEKSREFNMKNVAATNLTNETYAKKRAYEAFQKYEERNQEGEEKVNDLFKSFHLQDI